MVSKMVSNAPLSIDHVSIDSLQLDPANPRRMADAELEMLTRSIREFGFVDPVIARREDGVVVGGHQRLLAARKLGMKTVPVVYVDLTLEQARLLNLALNKISGSFDEELLARLLAELNLVPDVDLTLSGFREDELGRLLKSLDAREKRERVEDFDLEAALEEAAREPRTKLGDVWVLGEHRLLCGDATDPAQVRAMLGETRAAMAFTDPPYNVGYEGGASVRKGRKAIANDDLGENFGQFLGQACRNILTSTDGAVYVCMSSSELHTLQRAFVEAGGHWSTFIIWAKDRFTLGRSDYQRQYEPILYGWREGAQHHWCGDRDQGDIWTVERPSSSEAHPTMKPLALVERALGNSSRAGDVVLDTFLGSGSTLIACERTGRVCYGMELDPHYCDVVLMRWEAFSGMKAERIGDGE